MTFDGREPTAHLHLRLAQALKTAVAQEARERGISVRRVFEAALRDRYDPERAARDRQLLARELKSMRREITHVSAGNKILFEAMALLVKNLFSSLTPPTAEGRLAGDAFYSRFMDAVVRGIETNAPLMDQVLSLAIVAHDSERTHPDTEKADA